MSLYAYAVIDSAGAIDPVPGLFGAPVYNVPYRQIGAVVSDLGSEGLASCRLAGSRLEPATCNLKPATVFAFEHSAVTDNLMADFTVLPIRFGTVFPSSVDLIVKVEECHADFCSNLKRLRGKVEFGLRVIWPGEAIQRQLETEGLASCRLAGSRLEPATCNLKPATVSREFLDAKLVRYRCQRAFEQRAEQEIAAIDHAFCRSVAEKRYERLQTPNLLLSAYYLVERVLAGDFRVAYERLRAARPDLKYLISGPWPPYNFCQLKGDSLPSAAACHPGESYSSYPSHSSHMSHPASLAPHPLHHL